ncbi:MAG: hypothetical protein H7A33_08220 [Deltaproteobacteria bacterium]|nr:hypothetical protein [Deltaproteobacteria bacterium]
MNPATKTNTTSSTYPACENEMTFSVDDISELSGWEVSKSTQDRATLFNGDDDWFYIFKGTHSFEQTEKVLAGTAHKQIVCGDNAPEKTCPLNFSLGAKTLEQLTGYEASAPKSQWDPIVFKRDDDNFAVSQQQKSSRQWLALFKEWGIAGRQEMSLECEAGAKSATLYIGDEAHALPFTASSAVRAYIDVTPKDQ